MFRFLQRFFFLLVFFFGIKHVFYTIQDLSILQWHGLVFGVVEILYTMGIIFVICRLRL